MVLQTLTRLHSYIHCQGAFSLREGDELAQLLARITGNEILGYNDGVWRDLLLQYEKLVHVHNQQDVLSSACKRCSQNCAASSNLATFALHVRIRFDCRIGRTIALVSNVAVHLQCARIIRDLQVAVESFEDSCSSSDESPARLRTALIGKSRVTCGAINLLRILAHEVIVDACRSELDTSTCLVQSFTYRGKEGEQDSAYQVTATLMHFLAAIGRIIRRQTFDLLSIPEVYDVLFQVLALFLTLLSSQLYQPLISSNEALKCDNLFLNLIMNHARTGQRDEADGPNEAASIVSLCLDLFIARPTPPQRSILAHQLQLVDSIVKELVAKKSDDGMHESHTIVHARYIPADKESRDSLRLEKNTREPTSGKSTSLSVSLGTDDEVNLTSAGHVSRTRSSVSHPIRSLLLLSSSFFLLPLRLVKLALGLLGQNKAVGNGGAKLTASDQTILQQMSQGQKESGWNKTSNVLWVTESPLSDFGSALLLVLLNNCRAATNPFRCEVASLNDSRMNEGVPANPLSINFGDLFESFGTTCHTEVSALLLYTLTFASSSFAESIAARIDPDRLIIPLLRSLYVSTTATDDVNKRPFRSHSQLYVIMILVSSLRICVSLLHTALNSSHANRNLQLLVFSQDTSFGRNSFRRIKCRVVFYKELPQEVSLGAAILAVLLRTISTGLELQDAYLLSNCFAVLLNISPHINGIDPYVAHRLVSVAAISFKRYAVLIAENGGQLEVEGDVSTPIGMHGETCRTLLQLIKHSIRSKCLAKNIYVVFEILRDQKVFAAMLQCKHDGSFRCISETWSSLVLTCLPSFKLDPSLGDLSAMSSLIATAQMIVKPTGGGISARKTLKLLEDNISELKSYSSEGTLLRQNSHSDDSSSVASDASDLGNLTFQYEEESDPEVFFLPYLWDIVVSTLTTSSSMEWRRSSIQIFALNNDVEDGVADNSFDEVSLAEHSGDLV